MTKLEIKDLHVSIDGKQIVKGLNLTINPGEIHALMGPNGSGKSTLAQAIMGHPRYTIDSGSVLLDGEDILRMSVDKRAKKGLFLSFQYPAEVPGVSMMNFFRMAMTAQGAKMTIPEFRKIIQEKMGMLHVDESFAKRYLNEGFSGGEKKRSEILQMALLNPRVAILDETDSGLDIDALKIVSESIAKLAGPDTGVLLITHYNRMLKYITPHYVHIMQNGKIVKSGDSSLALQLDEKGYENLIKELVV